MKSLQYRDRTENIEVVPIIRNILDVMGSSVGEKVEVAKTGSVGKIVRLDPIGDENQDGPIRAMTILTKVGERTIRELYFISPFYVELSMRKYAEDSQDIGGYCN
ncbi:MAG: hypothetical protein WC584_05195 [Candidatus Pacearchaeota archaeon]